MDEISGKLEFETLNIMYRNISGYLISVKGYMTH